MCEHLDSGCFSPELKETKQDYPAAVVNGEITYNTITDVVMMCPVCGEELDWNFQALEGVER